MNIPESYPVSSDHVRWNNIEELKASALALGCHKEIVDYAIQSRGENFNAVANYIQWHIVCTAVAEVRSTLRVKAHRQMPVARLRTGNERPGRLNA